MEYDEFGRQTAWKASAAGGREKTLESYTYNNKDLLSKVTYGNGNTVSYTYNQKNQLVSVYSLDALTTSFSYDTLGRHTRTDDGTNGLKTFYTYTPAEK